MLTGKLMDFIVSKCKIFIWTNLIEESKNKQDNEDQEVTSFFTCRVFKGFPGGVVHIERKKSRIWETKLLLRIVAPISQEKFAAILHPL